MRAGRGAVDRAEERVGREPPEFLLWGADRGQIQGGGGVEVVVADQRDLFADAQSGGA
ncbi:MAG: hypothetical protein QM679_08105 [Patulibacter sp.]